MALENHFTTSEQSKRLLELGVPLTSADCVRNPSTGMVFFIQEGRVTEGYLSLYKASRGHVAEAAWTDGRLVEIAHICSGSTLSYKEEIEELQKFQKENKCATFVEAVIMCIEDAISIGSIDFSKLEE